MTAAELLNHAGSLTWYLPPHGFSVAAEAGMTIPHTLFRAVLDLVEAVERMDDPNGGLGPVRDALANLNAKAAELGGR